MRFFLFFCLFLPLESFGISTMEKSCFSKIQYQFSFSEIQQSCESLPATSLGAFNKDGFSALTYAVKNRDRKTALFLLKKGVNPNVRNRHWADSMHIAAIFGATDLIPVLRSYDADIDSPDDEGNTPLMNASERGNLDVLKVLVGLGAHIDHRNQWNQSALSLAARQGSLPIVEFLYNAGAKAHFFTYVDGQAPIHEASISNHAEVLRFLLQKSEDPNTQSLYTGMTPLAYSVVYGASQTFSYLLALPTVDVNRWDFKHQTPLFLAVKMGRKEMIRPLLAHGAKIDMPNQDSLTPIELSKNKGENEILKILLEFAPH